MLQTCGPATACTILTEVTGAATVGKRHTLDTALLSLWARHFAQLYTILKVVWHASLCMRLAMN